MAADNGSDGKSRRPSKLLERARTKVKQKKADREAKKLARKNRIARNDPEGATEEVEATLQQAKLIASEFGITTENAKRISSQITSEFEEASDKGGDALKKFDVDGDGDTDMLQLIEQRIEQDRSSGGGGGGSSSGGLDESEVDGGVNIGEVEEDIGYSGSIEDDLGF